MSIIYKTTNLINNKIYVGLDSFNNPKYLGSGKLLKRSINKYGKDNFKKITLETCSSKEELIEKEIYWIKELNSNDLNIGYNLTSGGEGSFGYIKSKETRKKISETLKELYKDKNKHPSFGTHHTKEARKKMSETRKELMKVRPDLGWNLTQESIDKMAQTLKDKYKEEGHPMLGKTHNKKTKEKMSNSSLMYVYEYYNPKGKVIQIKSMNQFCKDNGLNRKHMRDMMNKKRKEYKGWTFKKVKKLK